MSRVHRNANRLPERTLASLAGVLLLAPAGLAPVFWADEARAGSARSASKSSIYETKSNSRRYRRQKAREASETRSKVRRATRKSRYGRDHQPGGYCIYDANGNVVLQPEGGGGAAAIAPAGPRTGCVTGDCKNGRGTWMWSNGSQYSGEWKGGRQHGQGTLLLSEGSSYVGGWMHGMKHGQGTATYSDGRVQAGYWDKNRYRGTSRSSAMARIRWPDLTRLPERRAGGGKKDAAVVVGVSRYAHVSPIAGANDNATDWFNYLVKSRGVPVERVALLVDEDATVEEMLWAAEDAAKAVKRGGTLWFVFVGHGAPSRDGRDGLLVGFDAQQKARSIESRSLRRSQLLAALQDSRAGSVQVFLDACFSGRTGSGQQLVAGLQPLVVTSLEQDRDPRTALFTAAESDQFAGPLPGADRPAFSYLALGGLRGWADIDEDGRVTSGELHRYTRHAMRALVRDRRQVPTLDGPEDARIAKSAREKGPDIAGLVIQQAAR